MPTISDGFKERMADTEGLEIIAGEPSSLAIASEIVLIAKELLAIDFPNQKELNKYMHDHPAADRAHHRVVKTEPPHKKPEEKPAKHISFDKPVDLSGGRTRDHRKNNNHYIENEFSDEDLWKHHKNDYRTIEIAHDLPLGELNPEMKKLKQNLAKESEGMTDKMLYAIQVHKTVEDYTSYGYKSINHALKHGKQSSPALQQKIDDLDKFIAYSPKYKGDTLYRGADIDKHLLDKLKPGSIISEKKFVSTSSVSKAANDFSDEARKGRRSVKFIIEGAKGVSLADYSKEEHEKEVLLPRNSKFKVVSIDRKNNSWGDDMYYVNVKAVK